jgi:hypothetical protein
MAEAPEWPALPLAPWEPTRATLHMWTQIVGKVRLALSAYQNHWWQVPLYVSAMIEAPAFYTYASPQPRGFAEAAVRPAATRFNKDLSQFQLMYDDARQSPSPRRALIQSGGTGLPKPSVANATQIFSVDRAQLIEHSGVVTRSESEGIDHALRLVLQL